MLRKIFRFRELRNTTAVRVAYMKSGSNDVAHRRALVLLFVSYRKPPGALANRELGAKRR